MQKEIPLLAGVWDLRIWGRLASKLLNPTPRTWILKGRSIFGGNVQTLWPGVCAFAGLRSLVGRL